MKPPMIMVSTGNSGSSALMEILNKLGLSLGKNIKQYSGRPHFEHLWFQGINRRILGAKRYPYSWLFNTDRSKILNTFLNNEQYIKETNINMFEQMKSEDIKKNEPWGFKDPRTCLTFPFWYKVCPDAKYLFLDRKPEDAILKWNNAGTEGYHIFRKYFDENKEIVKKDNSDYFVLKYDILSNEWSNTIKNVMNWLGLSNFSRIEKVRSLWKPMFKGKTMETMG